MVGKRDLPRGQEETFGGDECVSYLDYGDGFAGINMSKHEIVHFLLRAVLCISS